MINTPPAEKFEQTPIPGSLNLPQDEDEFVQRGEEEAGGKIKPVLVYCASEERSSSTEAAQELRSAEFSTAMDYEGGYDRSSGRISKRQLRQPSMTLIQVM